jgi:hypothetical protein
MENDPRVATYQATHLYKGAHTYCGVFPSKVRASTAIGDVDCIKCLRQAIRELRSANHDFRAANSRLKKQKGIHPTKLLAALESLIDLGEETALEPSLASEKAPAKLGKQKPPAQARKG